MTRRTIGIDLAIRGDQVAQIFDDGRPIGKPIRFRLEPVSLDRFVAKARRLRAPVELLVHAGGPHGFDVTKPDDRTRAIMRRTLAFLRLHLLR